MHPLIAAHIRLAEWRAIEPRPWGLYWPMWQREFLALRDFIRELTPGGVSYSEWRQ